MTFLVIDRIRHWSSISNLLFFLKKVIALTILFDRFSDSSLEEEQEKKPYVKKKKPNHRRCKVESPKSDRILQGDEFKRRYNRIGVFYIILN